MSRKRRDLRSDRDEVVEYLRQQLVGPVGSTDEELEGSPLDRYLLGVLYPQSSRVEALHQEEESDPSPDGVDEEAAENPISMAFERLPASMGISFFVKGTKTIQCRVWGAVYSRVVDTNGRKGEFWQRQDLANSGAPETLDINAPDLPERSYEEKVLQGRAILHSFWRPMESGYLVTVTLVNAVTGSDSHPDPADCLFQVGVSCEGLGGGISEYKSVQVLRHDEEEEELALLYRHKRVYAVGHGCAAAWIDNAGDIEVSTTVMPCHETLPITRDLQLESGESSTVLDVLELRRLADDELPIATLANELQSFVERYGHWIESVELQVGDLKSKFGGAGTRIVERLRRALLRMKNGIDELEGDPVIARAFRLATRAMLMQMVHSGKEYGGTTRSRDEKPFVQPAYKGEAVSEYRWYPFQLAFQLLTLKSVADPAASDRDLVDLIWFPTGGGKTEAYLWVAAFEMFLRRLRHGERGAGTAVIKRYTLRLLTSQQFQRAATLICACEQLRQSSSHLGKEPFRLGLWIGGTSTANTFGEAVQQYEDLLDSASPENPFQLQRCPWCGTRIVPGEQEHDKGFYGVRAEDTRFDFYCPTQSCPFHEWLPVGVVDDELFLRPPSLLIGTIDKFARLAWDDRSSVFFGGETLPPGLIIQDELHLISGPLGTIAGIYEAAIDCLLTRDGNRPKIIAATATIRRAMDQAERLYARKVAIFPPPGVSADDSYFARTDQGAVGRLYVGVMGQGHTGVTSLVRAAAAVSQATKELTSLSDEAMDGYWTQLIYHNSKRELGKTMALSRDDIPARIQVIARDGSNLREIDNVEELSANIAGRRIPEVLLQLEKRAGRDAVDILPCTNMISVGVDVKRLGVMVVVGQPKTTAEYIQATSRVGRDKVPGLVITMCSQSKPRDRSHYESFRAYHDALYRWVEPTSVTPFALPARERALHAALVIVARHAGGLTNNPDASQFDPDAQPLRALIHRLIDRMSCAEPAERDETERHLQRLVTQWATRARMSREKQTGPLVYNGSGGPQFESLICPFDEPRGEAWKTLNSMRHVDSECLIYVNGEKDA